MATLWFYCCKQDQCQYLCTIKNWKQRYFSDLALRRCNAVFIVHISLFRWAHVPSDCGGGDFFFFLHTYTFQLLDKPWSQVSSLLPPGSCLQFLSRIKGSAIPLLVDFLSNVVANSRSRAFHKSICAQEKVPSRICMSMHSGGLELAKLAYARLEDNLIRHRGDRLVIYHPGIPSLPVYTSTRRILVGYINVHHRSSDREKCPKWRRGCSEYTL